MVNLQQRSFKLHLFLLTYKVDYTRGEIISVHELFHNVKFQNYSFEVNLKSYASKISY